ncbi:MAG: LamG domain-containing protein [Anaerolineae bacterium]|nr:LamG domain-containing protein [Anaerolineae bacterium]
MGGQTAELVNDAGFGAGMVDQAFMLKEEGGMATSLQDFVNVPHDPALNLGTGDFTVDLWVYFNDTEGEQVLIEKWIQGMELYPSFGWTLTKLEGNVLRLAVAAGGEEIDIDSGVLDIPTHTWLHFAATRKDATITLYMNGSPVATGAAPLNLDSDSSLKFGHRGNKIDTPGSEDNRGFYLNGRIDEVQLFVGQALPRGLIRTIYEAGSAGQCKD